MNREVPSHKARAEGNGMTGINPSVESKRTWPGWFNTFTGLGVRTSHQQTVNMKRQKLIIPTFPLELQMVNFGYVL